MHLGSLNVDGHVPLSSVLCCMKMHEIYYIIVINYISPLTVFSKEPGMATNMFLKLYIDN